MVGQRRPRRARPRRAARISSAGRLRAVAGPRVGVEVDAHPPTLGHRSHQAGAGTSERQLDQRRPDGRTRRAGSSRRAAAASPRPAAAPATASGRRPRRRTTERSNRSSERGRRHRPQRDGLAVDPDPHGRRPVPHLARRGRSCRVPAHRAPRPVPGSSATTSTSTGPSSSLVPETQVIVARPRVRGPTTAKSVTRPARAHRPRQVRREVARPRPGGRRTRRTTPRSPAATAVRPRRARGSDHAPPGSRRRGAGTPRPGTCHRREPWPNRQGRAEAGQEFQARITAVSRS